MNAEDFIVKKTIRIKGSTDKVWEALTNPEKTKKYFYNAEVFSDWKPGSPITFKGEMEGKPFELKGEILVVEPGKLLKYRLDHESETPDANARGYSIVTDSLETEGDQTVLHITDDTGSEAGYKKSGKGWDMVLNGLKQVVEGESEK